MIGLPIAIALGSLIGKSEYGLEVLKEVSPQAVERGKAFIDSVPIEIKHLPNAPSNLHVDVEVRAQVTPLELLFRANTRSLFFWKKTVRQFLRKKKAQEMVMLKTQMLCG